MTTLSERRPRGAPCGMGADARDVDNDGRVDAVVRALEAPLEMWHNVSPAPRHWLLVVTVGSTGNTGVGAKIRIVTASGTQYGHVNTAVGYGCASDPRVHFGLGPVSLPQGHRTTQR